MKKITIIFMFLAMLLVFTGCSDNQLIRQKMNSSDINKIQVITAMGNPAHGADSKTITSPEEIERFVDTFNSAEIGNQVADEHLGVGGASYYYFYQNEELLALFTFNVNDTNIIWHNGRYHYVIYGQNQKTPYELYQESDAEVIVVDESGNILEIPEEERPVEPPGRPTSPLII